MNTSLYVELSANVAAAHLRRAGMHTQDVPSFIRTIHATLVSLALGERDLAVVQDAEDPSGSGGGAPSIPECASGHAEGTLDDVADGYVRNGRKTLFDDHILCLEDDRSVILLARHLRHMGMEPDAYRRKWSLPLDYPMVAPRYSREKREIALRSRFGRDIRPTPLRRLAGILSPVYGSQEANA